MKTGYKDSSGMTLHYTNNKRTHDASNFMIGQYYLDIPPGRESVEIGGDCPSDITQIMLTGPVYVTSAFNHMHYMGRHHGMANVTVRFN